MKYLTDGILSLKITCNYMILMEISLMRMA